MSVEATEPGPKTGIKKFFSEAVLVAMGGLVLAFAANALSPRGLKLARDYFPTGTNYSALPLAVTELATNAAPTNSATSITPITSASPPPKLIVVPRLAEKGLQAIDGDQATRFFDDSRRLQGAIVFVDARSDQNYQEGHVPSAYQFDPYHPEKHLATVFPVCQAAELIVVYCTGSDCEDSELGAILLRDAGIANQKLFVYVAGITEWTARNLPTEIGGRNSGNLRNANQ